MRFNANHYVRVRLTARGHQLLREQHAALLAQVPSLGEYKPPAQDADGWSRWQLWVLMADLGQHCVNGMPAPFHPEMEIEVDPVDSLRDGILAWMRVRARPVLLSELIETFGNTDSLRNAVDSLLRDATIRPVFPEAQPGNSGRQHFEIRP